MNLRKNGISEKRSVTRLKDKKKLVGKICLIWLNVVTALEHDALGQCVKFACEHQPSTPF